MITRATSADLQIRSDGRTVHGLVVPFDREAQVDDGAGPYREVFRPGAFRRTIVERGQRVKLLVNHDRKSFPIGRATHLREDPAGLLGDFHVSQTEAGDQALELVRDGVLDAFSVGFAEMPNGNRVDPRAGLVERVEVRLNEASLVAFPAYEGALVAGVRHQEPRPSIDLYRKRLFVAAAHTGR